MFKFIIILLIFNIISCGKKGVLYIPEQKNIKQQEEVNGLF
jgi:predicted small lipoprotein YifL